MESNEKNNQSGLEIAVIGMAGRFPKAKNIEEYWNNLKKGVECITFFTPAELEESGVNREMSNQPNFVKASGMVEDVDYYDASFFGYLPVDAELMDPQMRIFHECVWEALEDAGYVPDTYKGRIGIYAGASAHLRWEVSALISGKPDILGHFAAWQLYDKDFMSTRISYNLNLSGPSVNVQTACSTSLTAIHLACQGLLSGECHLALAGGITASIPLKKGYTYQEGMIISLDGHCRTFAHNSSGIVPGEGAGVVLLKPLEDAMAERDFIYAVIKSSAINNDGKGKVGYTAPSVKGQARVIRSALRLAHVKAESISYVETHGTGTNLGDPAEIEALKLAFKTDKKGFCRIGSVKSNLGHLGSAAGVAGFIKTVLALKHKLIPPSLHFVKPNPKIDFENSPFVVNTRLTPWENNGTPLRAGVSSFGIGGTNVHMVLEEWPGSHSSKARARENDARREKLIVLSARSESALEKAVENLNTFLQKNPGISLADAAYTLQVGRKAFKHRRVILCRDIKETLASPSLSAYTEIDNRQVVFMFPGQGSQYVNMGLDLYRTEPVFRQEIDRCFEILEPLMGYDIKEILYPSPSLDSSDSSHKNINQTEVTQPVLFALEYALSQLLMKWGIVPYAMVGHSLGEYVAACLSGVFTLEDALQIVALRGQLMQQLPPGAMLSVSLAQKELTPLLSSGSADDISLAAVNSPRNCVVSGPLEAIERFSRELTGMGYENRRLHSSHAFHSRMMDPILEELTGKIKSFSLNKPRIPYISNLTGKWITVGDALDPGYWSKHLRQIVIFSDGMEELLKNKDVVFLEVGPGNALAAFARQHLRRSQRETNGPMIIELMRHPKQNQPDNRFLFDKIGQLWLGGVKIDWAGFNANEKRYRMPLPTYPFERQHFPVASDPFAMELKALTNKASSREKNKEIADWFYIPSWERTPFPHAKSLKNAAAGNWLVFIDQHGIGHRLIEKIKHKQFSQQQTITIVKVGPGFSRESDREFMINPKQESDYHQLFKELKEIKVIPRKILHLWGITGDKEKIAALDLVDIDTILETGFHSLVNIARAVGRQRIRENINIGFITDGMQEVIGNEPLCPGKAAVLGAVKVIPSEYSNIRCCSIDISALEPGMSFYDKSAEQLIAEFAADLPDQVIAYRGSHRWVQVIKPAPLDTPGKEDDIMPPLRKNGVYLITGGLGGIGLTLAAYLAQSVQARLVLTGRTSFPAREAWHQWLASHDKNHRTAIKIRKLMEMENQGAEILVVEANAANLEHMQQVNRTIEQQWGPVNGIIHAAGVPDGALIQARTPAMTESVFESKIKGTLVLDHIFDHKSLDFFILCSSLSSVVGSLGQVAYSAANTFQDAYALYKTYRHNHPLTVAIGWDAWQEVGMAVEAVKKLARTREIPPDSLESSAPRQQVAHPLFDYSIEKNADEKIYITHFQVDKYWVLKEHRILDKPTLPGTALVEMARAVLEDHTGNPAVEITEIYFLTPLRLEETMEKKVRTLLKKQGNTYKFNISSQADPGNTHWVEHVRGEMALLERRENKIHDIEEMKAKCSEGEIIVTPEMLNAKREGDPLKFVFGPRWKNVRQINYGSQQVLIMLELDREFSGDLELYKLHPALLDTATGNYNRKNSAIGASLPFAYKKVKVKAPLTSKIYSYQEYSAQTREEEKILKCNITIMDDRGMELVEIREYQRRAVSGNAAVRLSQETKVTPGQTTASPNENTLEYKEILKHGLLPEEGVEAFRRILGKPLPHVVISTIDLAARLEANPALKDEAQLVKKADPAKSHVAYRSRPGINTPYIPPASDNEREMAQIWQDFLGIEKLGTRDNFFELGGDSLKVLTIISIIHKKMDVEVSIGEFFNNPTIAGVAEYINGINKYVYTTIEPVEKKEYYPLSSAQKRLYFITQLDLQSTAYNLPKIIEINGTFDKEKLRKIFLDLIRRHESMRTSFEVVESEPVQKISDHVQFSIEGYDITGYDMEGKNSHKNNSPYLRIMIEEKIGNFIRPFELSNAPLVRAGLIKTGENKHILMTDMHHIISDGVSSSILIKDFTAFHRREQLIPLKIQYKDFSQWQNNKAKQEEIQRQQEFWLDLFKGEIPILNLPIDYERPLLQDFEGYTIEFTVRKKEYRALKELALKVEGTLYMVILAIYYVLLFKLSGQEDIVVGTDIAGRNHMHVEQIIGMFVNTLALRNAPTGEKTFLEFLGDVKERTLKAFENKDYPFDDLVTRVVLQRDPGRNPLFDVMFAFWKIDQIPGNAPGLELLDLEMNEYKYENKTSKFDLLLTGIEMAGNVHFTFEYCTKLFKEETIKRFIDYFKEIVSSVITDPGKKIFEIDTMGEEKKVMLFEQIKEEIGIADLEAEMIENETAEPDEAGFNF